MTSSMALPIGEDLADTLADAGWVVIEDFLPAAEWSQLALEGRASRDRGAFRQAGIGRGKRFTVRPDIRNDRICWLEPERATPAYRRYLARIEALRLALNRSLYLGLFEFEAHFALYPPGGFYRPHLDCFRDTAHRLISCILYLNSDWQADQGGMLRLYPENSTHRDIPPAGGTLVMFRSDRLMHEVLPATRERLSLTGWLCRRR